MCVNSVLPLTTALRGSTSIAFQLCQLCLLEKSTSMCTLDYEHKQSQYNSFGAVLVPSSDKNKPVWGWNAGDVTTPFH